LFLQAAYRAGDTVLAQKVSQSLRKDLEQQITYFNSLDETKQSAITYENQVAQQLLQQLQGMEQYFKSNPELNPETKNPVINNIPVPKKEKPVNDKTQ
jgi:flagellar biosynthesis component FlhA